MDFSSFLFIVGFWCCVPSSSFRPRLRVRFLLHVSSDPLFSLASHVLQPLLPTLLTFLDIGLPQVTTSFPPPLPVSSSPMISPADFRPIPLSMGLDPLSRFVAWISTLSGPPVLFPRILSSVLCVFCTHLLSLAGSPGSFKRCPCVSVFAP